MSQTYQIVAKTHQGLEELLASEIKAVGGQRARIGRRAVFFEGDLECLYRANLVCSTALRFLMEVTGFQIRKEDDLYTIAKTIIWEKFITPETTFAVDAVVYSSLMNHSHFAALKIKDSIVDRIREVHGVRPNVDTEKADVRVHLHVSERRASIMLDSSGSSLHKRGYKISGMAAPLNEVLAAGLIRITGWKGDTEFIDPMCGSGTLPIEAALFASNTPVNYRRNFFGFQNWPNYDHALWEKVYDEEMAKVKSVKAQIRGSDVSFRAVQASRNNAEAAGMSECIKWNKGDFRQAKPGGQSGIFVVNPPYGERLQPKDIHEMYSQLGTLLKHNYAGYSAWILSSNVGALRHVGLKPSTKLNIFNGALQTKFMGYSLYDGSRKKTPK